MGIEISDLLASGTTFLASHFEGHKFKEFVTITKADKIINYEAAVNGEGIIFRSDGNFSGLRD